MQYQDLKKVIGNLRIKLAKMGFIEMEKVLEEEEFSSCPVCSSNSLNDYICNNCNLDLKEIFICPALSDEKFCVITKRECFLKSLEYEQCDIYHSTEL